MKIDSSSLKPLTQLLHHIAENYKIISFILAMATLIYCVYSIQQVFELPSDQEYYNQQLLKNTKTSFDKKTMDKVRQLRTSNDDPLTLPSGRINPFIEDSQ
ncbi:MAG: hypothetical protein WAW60_00325 [Candidatus Saccharimonadales bacterium]